MRPRKELAGGSHGERCDLVVLVLPGSVYERVTYLTEPPGDTAIPTLPRTLQGIRVSDSYWRDATTFEAKRGQPNAWTVRLPDELTGKVREKLKAESKK
ncbi:MAG: hypothetical protein ABSH35_05040 [Isosphaeraceae bacterium]